MTEIRSVSEGPVPKGSAAATSSVQLVCPACYTRVTRCGDAWVCESAECRRRYPVIDDIPKFIIEDAEQLEPADWEALVSPIPPEAT